MKNYGRRSWMQSIRTAKKLTQTQAAEAIGISLNYYQRIEYGERNPSPELAMKISTFFNVPLDWLYTQRPDAVCIQAP